MSTDKKMFNLRKQLERDKKKEKVSVGWLWDGIEMGLGGAKRQHFKRINLSPNEATFTSNPNPTSRIGKAQGLALAR